MRPPAEPTRLLVVSPFADDHARLRLILLEPDWHISSAANCAEAVSALRDGGVEVVLTERDLPDAHWTALLDEIDGLPDAPHVIVTATDPDSRVWAEVLNLGGRDVLSKPFDDAEVNRTVSICLQRSN